MDAFPEQFRWLAAMPFYLAAYAAAVLAFRWLARRRGLDTDGMRLLMCGGLIGGLAGANLAQWLAAGTPGKTIEGGILGGFLTVIWLKRKLGITRPTGDMFALGIAAGEAVGRLGCFVGGCCSGRFRAPRLRCTITVPSAIPRSSTSASRPRLTFAILVLLERKHVLPENGLLWVQIALFCIARFTIEFVREGGVTQIGLTLAQLACLAGFAFAVYKLPPGPSGSSPARTVICPQV